VVWSASGGIITASGLYTADSIEGAYQVTAAPASASSAASHTSAVTAQATVHVNHGHNLAQLIVSPASATLSVDDTLQFLAYGRLNNGDSVAVSVTWSATGGTITTTGLYRAGQTPGSYAVTAAEDAGSLDGTAGMAVTAPPPSSVPGTVTDLALAGVTDNSVTLAFTEVSDGTGQPASYDVRYAPSPISWGSATSVTGGTCATPLRGSTIGAKRTCTVLGLSAATAYGFQLVAFRGTLGLDAVFGTLSNVANGTTAAGAAQPVASVTVSPASASVSVGGTQQFTATLKDASGTVLSGRSVSWSSSNPLVATVSGSGLATGLVAGTTTLTATSEGKSGQAALSVTVLPPPSTGWANEPSGHTLVSDYAFNDDIPVTSADVAIPGGSGWNSVYNGSGYMTRGSVAGGPLSPTNVLQFVYPTGFPGSMGPATAWRPLPGLRRAYVGQWWKVSNPWQGHVSGVNKIGYLFTSGQGSMFLAMYGPPGGPYELRVFPQFSTSQDVWLVPNVAHVPVTLGVWHKLEWLVEYDGGVVKWWMDGQLLGSYTGVPMPSVGLSEYHLDPVWGGCCDPGKTETDYYWFDHIRISGN
jgi:hypothetical protein